MKKIVHTTNKKSLSLTAQNGYYAKDYNNSPLLSGEVFCTKTAKNKALGSNLSKENGGLDKASL